MGYSAAVSSSWDRERARGELDRRRVESRARDLPSRTRLASPVGRLLVGAVRASKRLLGGLRSPIGSRLHAAVQVVLALPGRRARRQREVALTAQLARSRRDPTTRSVACVLHGPTEGPGHEIARRSAFSSLVLASNPTADPPYGPETTSRSDDLVCVMSSSTEPISDDWLAALADAIVGDVVAATPTMLRPLRSRLRSTPADGSVLTAGIDIVIDETGAPAARARDAGRSPHLEQRTEDVAAATGCLLVDRRALERAGGLAPLAAPDAAIGDLCARLEAGGGKIVAVRSTFAIDHATRPAMPEVIIHRDWRAVVERQGPTLWRRAAGVPVGDDRLRFAITIAAPSAKLAPRWGDWHLAGGLARALERAGHSARVQTLDRADDLAGRSCDVHLVLRGRQPVRRSLGQCHVLWIISHPDTVEIAECDRADLVLVASERFANHLRERTSTPVEVFLQATDQHRFRPLPPARQYAHAVAVVAKTRDQPRPIVMDAIASGLRPAIYGTGWDAFVDPYLIMGPYVANEDLPLVYSSVGVLLNDHWPAMRDWGFVSNRLFDALACGASVVSDHLPEIGPLFAGAVWTYEDRTDLRERVDEASRRGVDHQHLIARGRELVLTRHTFDVRVEEIGDLLARHGLLAGMLP